MGATTSQNLGIGVGEARIEGAKRQRFEGEARIEGEVLERAEEGSGEKAR